MNFDQAIERILKNEGGYSNDSRDPGGETNFGITWPCLKEGIALHLLPAATTIRSLTRDDAKVLYKALFWNRVHADAMPTLVQFQALDFAINSGIDTSVRYLQRALGVADDGKWGPVTQAAVTQAVPGQLAFRFLAERLDFLRKTRAWQNGLHDGLAGRIVNDLRYAAEDC